MSMTQSIVRRIFGDRKLPENLSNEEYDKYMQDNFPKWMKEFEDGGFLEKTKLPPIKSEEEFITKLQEHKDELMVIKYWKHGCIPCLTFAEMYKEAAERCCKEKKKIVWYSVDTKALNTRQLIDYQLISGTPTIQTFTGQKQVGNEIRAVSTEELLSELDKRVPKSTS
ncbi:thioredoxin, putative [Leishmania tarentolae]|uniref:Thioredoxin, putative n=1 Tax=Leishmania tarentolae TaxID=5689 RepID=A0A640KQI7_LEITA|nr:thioredoxin, putative [Leishmania tarentolae]